jgi:hypothetical protein
MMTSRPPSPAPFEQLAKIASRLVRHHVNKNSLPLNLYDGEMEDLMSDVVVRTVERVIKIERKKGPAPNPLGHFYKVMNYIILEIAGKLWKRLDKLGRQEIDESRLDEEIDTPLTETDRNIDLSKLKRFVKEELPAIYEEERHKLYETSKNKIYSHPQFLECAVARLNGKVAREAWKPLEGLTGGSWQNVEKLYQAWRQAVKRRLLSAGWRGDI